MKSVLITGAYRGLGFEVARELSERGWQVILTARRKNVGSAAAAKLKNATFLELDITNDASVARSAKKVAKLDVLINNAAIIADGDQDVLTIRQEVVAPTIETNALGALRVSQGFLPPSAYELCWPDRQRLQRGRPTQRHGHLVSRLCGVQSHAQRDNLPVRRRPEGQRHCRQFSLSRVVPHRNGRLECPALGR